MIPDMVSLQRGERTDARAKVYEAIDEERGFQCRKYGFPPRELPSWFLIIRSELEEAERAWVKNPEDPNVRCELLQVAAVAVAALEQHGAVRRREL